MHDMFRFDGQASREDATASSLPVLPTIDPAVVLVKSGNAASSSGLPIGPCSLGNRISASDVAVTARIQMRPVRTWFEESLSSIATGPGMAPYSGLRRSADSHASIFGWGERRRPASYCAKADSYSPKK